MLTKYRFTQTGLLRQRCSDFTTSKQQPTYEPVIIVKDLTSGPPMTYKVASITSEGTERPTTEQISSISMSAVEEQPAGPPDAFEELGDILKNQNHLFACSGSIPIRDEPEAAPDQRPGPDEQRTSRPVTIRWDTATASSPASERDACVKLTLPIAPERHGGVDHLCQHAQPATFGRGGEDVLDESYRKALKIDTDSFCSTFDPYTLGIIDTIAQVLLPSATDSKTHRSVRAELYKLNVRSSPSPWLCLRYH